MSLLGRLLYLEKLIKRPNKGMLRLATGNGNGSTANKVRIFSQVVEEYGNGSLYDYVTNATNGDSFTVLRRGIWSFSYTEYSDSSTQVQFALCKNVSDGTVQPANQPIANVLATGVASRNSDQIDVANIGWTGWLEENDVVYAVTQGSGTTLDSSQVTFSCAYLGSGFYI
jgi:hypothetical protein